MKATDFLTILGLALTAWSIIERKERKFILLFFSKTEIRLFVFLLLYIHWLFAFEWVSTNWWSGLSIFTHPKGIPPASWAYIFVLFTIGYPVIKVLTCFFPKSRKMSVLRLYNELLFQGEIQILADYIRKYHINDVETYLKKYSEIPDKALVFESRPITPEWVAYYGQGTNIDEEQVKKLLKKTRMDYAKSVYYRIICREEFIKKAALAYPEMFAQAIRGMSSTRVSNKSFVNTFLNTLIDEKSPQLIEELKTDRESTPILEAVLNNLEVAVENHIWYPFGEKGKYDLKHNNETKAFLAQEYDDSTKDQLWNHRIYSCIVFFHCMIRESICKGVKDHMWLLYYSRFVEYIIENIPKENEYQDDEFPSFNHYLIYQMLDNMIDWLRLLLEVKTDTWGKIEHIIECIGMILKQLSEADTDKISIRFKIEVFQSVFRIYFDGKREVGKIIRGHIENLFCGRNMTSKFRCALIAAWNSFDKVPYEYAPDVRYSKDGNKSYDTTKTYEYAPDVRYSKDSQDLLNQFQANVIECQESL